MVMYVRWTECVSGASRTSFYCRALGPRGTRRMGKGHSTRTSQGTVATFDTVGLRSHAIVYN